VATTRSPSPLQSGSTCAIRALSATAPPGVRFRTMSITEPMVQVLQPCPTCNGTGEVPVPQVAGYQTTTASGGNMTRCRDCDGDRTQAVLLTLPELANVLAPHLPAAT